eukprot:SAG31_NODE_31152_length_371_cov_1.128676_1_plen_29_part_10
MVIALVLTSAIAAGVDGAAARSPAAISMG